VSVILTTKTVRKTIKDDLYLIPKYIEDINNNLSFNKKITEISINWSTDGLINTVIWKFSDKNAYEEWINNPMVTALQLETEKYNASKGITSMVTVEELDDIVFCKSLTNAVSFRIPGDSNTLTFNPCCVYDDYIPFYPIVFHKVRENFSKVNTFLPGCKKCELKEKTHNTSLRIRSNDSIPNGLHNKIYKLEIVLDTTCNAACIQCGTEQSSLWRQQVSKIKGLHIQPTHQIDSRIEKIKEVVDMNGVKLFHFWGGEPLLTDTHLKFITEIENPQEVSLIYTSNCSIFPDDTTLKLWENFKSVRIVLSIDAIEERFHYIRWPLYWNKAKRNIELFRDSTPSNMEFNINCCIIPLNILYVTELSDYLNDNFKITKHGSKVSCNFIRGESTLDIVNTPMSMREEVWKELGEHHAVSKMLKEVNLTEPSGMISYLDFWDKQRNLNWRETFPKVAKHF
jgi:hypothetical protein